MYKIALARWQQGHRTTSFPQQEPTMPDRFRGMPVLDRARCPEGCTLCAEQCPTDAIRLNPGAYTVDLGLCLFCPACQAACPAQAITHTPDYRLAVRQREDLQVNGAVLNKAKALEAKIRRLFGHSLKLRQVSAGGCNACEADTNVLTTVGFDLGRFGIQFVASPRHADGVLITGPVTENMREALQKTYDAIPAPKLVIAVGACAISGGPFAGHPEAHNGAGNLLPVDLFIPGCPPHPITILDGLLRLLGRIEETADQAK